MPEKYDEHVMLLVLLLVLHFALAFALVYGLDQLALIPWRRAQSAHWTERARLLWPARVSNALLFFSVPMLLGAAQFSFFPEIPVAYLYAASAGIVGAALGMWPMARAVHPDLRWARCLRDLATLFLIRMLTLCILIPAGIWMPYEFGLKMLVITAGVIAAKLWLISGGILRLLRVSGLLVAPPGRLLHIVDEVAARMELPMPRVWVLRGYGANAVAFPVLRTLAVTEKALGALTDEELSAVCAHEFAHLNEPRGVVAALVLSAFVLLPAIFFKPAVHTWGMPGYFAICALVLIFSRLTKAFRRRMENRADSTATTHEGPSSGTYARALERIYEINQVPAVLSGSHIHPNLYDRLLAAGVTPAYPRPAAASRFNWQMAVVMLLLAASTFAVINRIDHPDEMKRRAAHAGATRVQPDRVE